MKIGYMVPEFPGQTHVFFWREILELEKLGADVNVVSTRPPRVRANVHEWTAEGMRRTLYLHPLGPSLLRDAFDVSLTGLGSCLRLIGAAEDVTWQERAKLCILLPYAIKLAAKARRESWQHLHTHFTFRAADVVLFASRLAGIPYSISKHGDDCGIGNQTAKWREAAFGTVITKLMLGELETRLGPALPAEVLIVSMGVNIDKLARKTPYRPWDGSGKLRIFSCGRIVEQKGHLTTVAMAAELVRRGVPVDLRIAGAVSPGWEPYRDTLERTIRDADLEDHVTLLGALSEEAVIRELEAAHLFVLAPVGEPLGVVYIEAMAMELPTVGASDGGVAELITDRVTGLLAPPRDPIALADAVAWIVAHPAEAHAIGRRARQWIVDRYQSKRGAESLFDAIARRIGGRAARSVTSRSPVNGAAHGETA